MSLMLALCVIGSLLWWLVDRCLSTREQNRRDVQGLVRADRRDNTALWLPAVRAQEVGFLEPSNGFLRLLSPRRDGRDSGPLQS